MKKKATAKITINPWITNRPWRGDIPGQLDVSKALLESRSEKRWAIMAAEAVRHMRRYPDFSGNTKIAFYILTKFPRAVLRAMAEELEGAGGADYNSTRAKEVDAYLTAADKASGEPELRKAYQEFKNKFPGQKVSMFSFGKTLRLLGLPVKYTKPGRPKNTN